MSIGRCRFTRVIPAEDIFQRKIDEIFKDLPNVFGIADDTFDIGYDADDKDHKKA